jgi:hypothetical protein
MHLYLVSIRVKDSGFSVGCWGGWWAVPAILFTFHANEVVTIGTAKSLSLLFNQKPNRGYNSY